MIPVTCSQQIRSPGGQHSICVAFQNSLCTDLLTTGSQRIAKIAIMQRLGDFPGLKVSSSYAHVLLGQAVHGTDRMGEFCRGRPDLLCQ